MLHHIPNQNLLTITIIVAVSENNAIGKNNALLWHLPNDLKFFKNKTWAMPVVYGRKTLNALNNRPLNGRLNMVLTRNNQLEVSGIIVVNDFELAKQKAISLGYRELMVLGGGEIYAQTLPYAHKMYITRVHHVFEDADAFFPAFSEEDWYLTSAFQYFADEKHAYAYTFETWLRKI